MLSFRVFLSALTAVVAAMLVFGGLVAPASSKPNQPKVAPNGTRVQIFPVTHVFRAGSKVRINIQAPGGDRTNWDFATIEKGQTHNTIGLGGAIPSKLVLPVVPGQTAQGTALPGPTALRGQPSRSYVPAGNGG